MPFSYTVNRLHYTSNVISFVTNVSLDAPYNV